MEDGDPRTSNVDETITLPQALAAFTRESANVLGIADETGTIEKYTILKSLNTGSAAWLISNPPKPFGFRCDRMIAGWLTRPPRLSLML